MRSIFCFLCLMFMTSALFASTSSTDSSWSKYSLSNAYIPIQIGRFWAHQGESQTIGINGLIGDRFTVTDHDDSNILVGIGYYANAYDNAWVHLLFGLNAYDFTPAEVHGVVTQEQLFTNLSFEYNITQYPLYVAMKAIFPTRFAAITFDLGLGPNFIFTSNLHEKSLDNGVTIPDTIFEDTSSVAFSANTGIGVQLNTKLPIECGYRFFYLGKGHLNKTNGQISDDLSTGNSYANAIVCSVTV